MAQFTGDEGRPEILKFEQYLELIGQCVCRGITNCKPPWLTTARRSKYLVHVPGHPSETPNPTKRRIFDFFRLFISQSIMQIITSNLKYEYIDYIVVVFK